MNTSTFISNTIAFLALLFSFLQAIYSKKKECEIQKYSIRSKHQYDMYSKKIDSYSSFLVTIGKCLIDSSDVNFQNLGAHIYDLFLFLPEEHWPLLTKIDEQLHNRDYKNIHDEIMVLSKILANDLKNMPPESISD